MRCRFTKADGTRGIQAAAQFAGRVSGAPVNLLDNSYHSTRPPYRYAREIRLGSDGTLGRHRAQGEYRDYYAATYEQWGHFLNFLFSLDPNASCGPYQGREMFDSKTAGKFPRIPAAAIMEGD